MKATRQLHELGQSLWLDNITRTLLDDGTLARYIAEDSITGLTSNPSIFDAAIGDGDAYDAVIDCSSDDRMPRLAVRLTRPAGRVVFIGLSAAPSLIDTRDLALQDITAVGVLSASPGLAGAIEAFASGAVVPDALVAEVVSLDSDPERFEGRRGAAAGPGPKVHVDPRA